MYKNLILPIIVGCLLLAVFVIIFKSPCENWVNYKQLPLGNFYTAADNPIVLYNVPRHREPYRYPVCHWVDYPVPHCKHNP